jgi:hypothetical protein
MRFIFVHKLATLLMGNARFWPPKEGGAWELRNAVSPKRVHAPFQRPRHVEGIQNPSEGNQNQSEQNQSPAERNPNPAERNPNLTSFHESSLFNGLSPTLTGRPLNTSLLPSPSARRPFAAARTNSRQVRPFVKKMSISPKAQRRDPRSASDYRSDPGAVQTPVTVTRNSGACAAALAPRRSPDTPVAS